MNTDKETKTDEEKIVNLSEGTTGEGKHDTEEFDRLMREQSK